MNTSVALGHERLLRVSSLKRAPCSLHGAPPVVSHSVLNGRAKCCIVDRPTSTDVYYFLSTI